MTGRVQLALNVDDLDESISFYSKLFGTEPAKVRPGYANFAISDPPLKLILIENRGQGGSLNHLGVEVADTDAVDAEQTRLAGVGLASVDERDTTCCYARQDKFWVQNAPNGERWEIYTVLEDSPTFWGQDGAQRWEAVEVALKGIVKNGLVFGISDRDMLFCINPQGGQTAWTTRTDGGRGYGSIVDAGPVLLALTPAGTLRVLEPSDKDYKELASYKVADGGTYAYPVISGKRIFVKDKDAVTLWLVD